MDHVSLLESVAENAEEHGSAVLLTTSPQRMAMIGTVQSADLLDFLETMFRASPGLKATFAEAMERSECPVS